jgi:hypothetical protein
VQLVYQEVWADILYTKSYRMGAKNDRGSNPGHRSKGHLLVTTMEHDIGKLLIEAELAERLGQAGQV